MQETRDRELDVLARIVGPTLGRALLGTGCGPGTTAGRDAGRFKPMCRGVGGGKPGRALTTAGTVLLLLTTSLGWVAESHARDGGLKISTGADGVRVITNETPVQHARRVATRRLPVPDPNLGRLIDRYSSLFRLDPELVQAVIQAESGYNERALSDKGAMGLMQLMPETAAELEVSDPYDPAENIRGGTRYLARLLERFGRLEVALAAYNAGPTVVARHDGVPPWEETRNYVRRVVRLYLGDDVEVDLSAPAVKGKKPYVVRRPGKRLLLTTDPPP